MIVHQPSSINVSVGWDKVLSTRRLDLLSIDRLGEDEDGRLAKGIGVI